MTQNNDALFCHYCGRSVTVKTYHSCARSARLDKAKATTPQSPTWIMGVFRAPLSKDWVFWISIVMAVLGLFAIVARSSISEDFSSVALLFDLFGGLINGGFWFITVALTIGGIRRLVTLK